LKVDEVLCDDAPKLCHSCAEVDISSRLKDLGTQNTDTHTTQIHVQDKNQTTHTHHTSTNNHTNGFVWISNSFSFILVVAIVRTEKTIMGFSDTIAKF